MSHRIDAYNERLEDFGYEDDRFTPELQGHMAVTLSFRLLDTLALLVGVSKLDSAQYTGPQGAYDWETYILGVHLRAHFKPRRWLVPYMQLGMGPGLGRTEYSDKYTKGYKEQNWGVHLDAALGLQFMPSRRLGFLLQLGYVWAPIIENEIDERHNSGGTLATTGIRIAY